MISRRTFVSHSVALGVGGVLFPETVVAGAGQSSVPRWGVFEIPLRAAFSGHPFDDVRVSAVFSNNGTQINVPGFYDGDDQFCIRFSPPELGNWQWRIESNLGSIDGQAGAFKCVEPGHSNYGPVHVSEDGYHFVYKDGRPYRQVGTTAYSWALQSDQKCAQTIETLRASPFNKIRMCVFPNVEAEATNPFEKTGSALSDWDPTRLDPAYFRRYEQRIVSLMRIGVEADLILYHPYGADRGYSDMSVENDIRYLKYITARFGAYRNVWWSMANEYDLIKSKSTEVWEKLAQTVVENDPHERLRSIHNFRQYYDYRQPWITHASVQNGAAPTHYGMSQIHRTFVEKPVIFDEVIYEGEGPKRWASLSGQDMVERFWWGTVAGTYVGHGETFAEGRGPDYSWLGQGGTIRGESMSRLRFLQKILDAAPVPYIDPIDKWWGYDIGGQPSKYYLKYFGKEQLTEWEMAIPGRLEDGQQSYHVDIIDTWNMEMTRLPKAFRMEQRDQYSFHDPSQKTVGLLDKPYMAIQLTRI